MSMERRVEVMIERNAELADLFVKLKEHHRLGMLWNNHDQETAAWGETEIKEWWDRGAKIMKAITLVSASSISDIHLKAQAAQMIIDLHGGGNDINKEIEKADTHEAMALSIVRDLLGSAARMSEKVAEPA